LILSWGSFCAISRTAGLSSLLWHRKTSKTSVLESCPFTQRQFYGRTRPDDNKLRSLRVSIPTGSIIPTPEQKRPPPEGVIGLTMSCPFTIASIMDTLNAVGTAAKCAGVECAVLSEQTGLRGCILRKESWAGNGHPAAAEPGMWLGHLVLRVIKPRGR